MATIKITDNRAGAKSYRFINPRGDGKTNQYGICSQIC